MLGSCSLLRNCSFFVDCFEYKNHGIKKINSVNEINIQNNIKKEPKENIKEKINSNAEESDEDSGDSLGLGNNSD